MFPMESGSITAVCFHILRGELSFCFSTKPELVLVGTVERANQDNFDDFFFVSIER